MDPPINIIDKEEPLQAPIQQVMCTKELLMRESAESLESYVMVMSEEVPVSLWSDAVVLNVQFQDKKA